MTETRLNKNERINKWKREQRAKNPEYCKRETNRVKKWRKKNPDKVREMKKRNELKLKQRTEAYRSRSWVEAFLQNEADLCMDFYNNDCI
jgi:hypothetical protein